MSKLNRNFELIRFVSVALAVLALCVIVVTEARAQDKWIAEDKALHLGAGFIASAIATDRAEQSSVEMFRKWPIATGFTAGCAVGAAKEVYDHAHPLTHTASWKDLIVTCIGALAGSAWTHFSIVQNKGTLGAAYSTPF